MFGNKDESGNPQIKAFLKTKNEGLAVFWFCSNTSSKRALQIKNDGNSCLYFYDHESWEGALLKGYAELSYDDETRISFWDDSMYQYYPLGAVDPDFVLIKFIAKSGNFYNNLKNWDFEIPA
jgi:general stress protein 26